MTTTNLSYDTHLNTMSNHLRDLGLSPTPLTIMSLSSDPDLYNKISQVFTHHVIQMLSNLLETKRPTSITTNTDPLINWVNQLPRLNNDSKTCTSLYNDIASAVVSFLQQIFPHSTTTTTDNDDDGQTVSKYNYANSLENIDTDHQLVDKDSINNATSPPALLPTHALPLFYILRPIFIKHLWPPSLMAPNFTKDNSTILPWVEQDMESILGHIYVTITIQTHLLALYGGSSDLLDILLNPELSMNMTSE